MPSTIIRRFDYRPETHELDVLFTTGRRYLYSGVPPEEAARFQRAFAKGRFFNARIRGRYPYEERPADDGIDAGVGPLTGTGPADVARGSDSWHSGRGEMGATAMQSENLALIKAIYQAFASGDIPGVVARMAPEMEWREAENFPYADGNPYRGPDAILGGVFARLASEWDGFAALPEQFLDAGDRIVVLGRYRGTFKATGRGIDAEMAHIWQVENGKAVRFRQLVDTLHVARATGAISP
jgi:ketosteroid isomerase-like protein